MTDRIIDLSETPAYLRTENDQLVIERQGLAASLIPLNEVAVVVLANPAVVCTQPAFAALATRGAAVVVCDRNSLPVGALLPIVGHSTQTERMAAQAAAMAPMRKRLWRDIVRHKIIMQAETLRELRGEDAGVAALARRVRSGDPENVEAQASARYWPQLFADPGFRRRRDAPDQNRMLNYGYAVLRAVVARAICAAGLHPSLALHHHNRYDAYCLADDLMEPYRPIVDSAVVECAGSYGTDAALTPPVKQMLLEPILGLRFAESEARSLFDWVSRTVHSLVAVYMHEANRLYYPKWDRGGSSNARK